MTLDIRIEHDFGGFTLNAEVTAPAGVTALFGKSGSGKTTLVNAVAGLLKPQAGHVAVGGRVLFDTEHGIHLPPHKRRLGYVFQDSRLFPHLTVRQNLCYGRWFSRQMPDPRKFDDITGMLGITDLLDRRPAALSGGEKQRVAIGRALLSSPEVLLLDEPLAALDQARKGEILPYLERLRDLSAIPILYVSHSLAEVARLATTVAVLEDGKVTRAGPIQEVLSDPDSAPALGVRDAGSVLSGHLAKQHADGLSELRISGGTLFLPRLNAPLGAQVRVRIEAQDVMLSLTRPEGISALNILPATVSAIRLGDGPGALVQLKIGGDHLLARITRRSAIALEIKEETKCFAVVKTVSVAQADVGAG